jgi:competence ComEA-like helix-hairpin-helix protein
MFSFTGQEQKALFLLFSIILLGTCLNFFSKKLSGMESVSLFYRVLDNIDINAADKKLLKDAGISERLARRIIEYRDEHGSFTEMSDLRNVKGVNEEKFTRLNDLFAVTGR